MTDEVATPAPDTADTQNDSQENWQQRYTGLQKVVAKRDTELHTANAALDALKAEHEAAIAELADYRQQSVDAGEEEAARQQYEQLRERFDPAPAPIGNNAPREWFEQERQSRDRLDPDTDDGQALGWPI